MPSLWYHVYIILIGVCVFIISPLYRVDTDVQPEEQREILKTVHSLRPRYPSHELSPLTFVSVGYDTHIVVAYVSQLAGFHQIESS